MFKEPLRHKRRSVLLGTMACIGRGQCPCIISFFSSLDSLWRGNRSSHLHLYLAVGKSYRPSPIAVVVLTTELTRGIYQVLSSLTLISSSWSQISIISFTRVSQVECLTLETINFSIFFGNAICMASQSDGKSITFNDVSSGDDIALAMLSMT